MILRGILGRILFRGLLLWFSWTLFDSVTHWGRWRFLWNLNQLFPSKKYLLLNLPSLQAIIFLFLHIAQFLALLPPPSLSFFFVLFSFHFRLRFDVLVLFQSCSTFKTIGRITIGFPTLYVARFNFSLLCLYIYIYTHTYIYIYIHFVWFFFFFWETNEVIDEIIKWKYSMADHF